MHIDSWDKQPIEERQYSRNRICINLGKEDRYLYFINLPIFSIYKSLPIKLTNINKVVNLFLSENQNYPVIKVKIKPMNGYIAPTENIIHDGSTFNTNNKDITLTIRGYFH